ncbi:methyltransferase [Ammonicoccus fulvus]|uniref:Methyltransferase n=1 Tax=Ammonicoccus fulvus TaxID=3138240 RepID=A0ABZ3FLX5_9ACTN
MRVVYMLDPVDRLILDESPEPTGRVLVIDAPGLAGEVGARGWDAVAYCDSLLDERLLTVPVVEELTVGSLAGVDLVLLRLPKSVAALEEYAQRLALVPGVRVVAGGRVKHMTRGMNEALATRFAEVSASLGRQKSRVLHASGPRPGGIDFPRTARDADLDLPLAAHGGTFAGTRVDPGTRLLVSVLDRVPSATVVEERGTSVSKPSNFTCIDLGSGNGTLSALLARAGHRVLALDESRAACLATAVTAAANGVSVEVRRADALEGVAPGSVPLIVCNPPFHVGTAKDSAPGLAMIDDAARALAPRGELWLVFNAHLPYLPRLRRIGRTEIVARNPKFIVTRSVRGS